MLWAYYQGTQVQISGETDRYAWGVRSLEFHRCRACGCVTHWVPVARESDRMGINARLLPQEVLAQVRVRRLDGAVTEEYFGE